MKKTLLLLSTLMLLTPLSHATNYYLSNNGNDNNNGISMQTPWKTIAKLNAVTVVPKDKILFKRGHLFRGSVATKGFVTDVTFDAYGSGKKPVISGSVKINSWKLSSLGKNIYEANVKPFIVADSKGVENTLEHLYVNGELMTIARYPNVNSPAKTNWLKVGMNATNDAFADARLAKYNKPLNYWKGATLRIRNYSWLYKVFPITGSNKDKLFVKGLGTQLPEWGYFIDGKKEELDYPGEWYYDSEAKKVYLYPKNGVNPNNNLVEAATQKFGLRVFWHEDNNIVQNLTFRHFTDAAIDINTSDNVTIRQNKFEYNQDGITTWNSANMLVSNNEFTQQFAKGILLNSSSDFNVQNSVVEKNTMTNIGMFPLYCARYEGTCYGIGINVFGKAYTVRENNLENIGWNGINLKSGGHHIIKNNTVKKSLALINDGGAINIGSDGNIIMGNFLLDTIGNVDNSNGCSRSDCEHYHKAYGSGIGADSGFKDNVIENNTIAHNSHHGIRLNSFTNTSVRNNTLFDNTDTQLVVEDKRGTSRNNTIEGNTFYSFAADQMGVGLTNLTHHGEMNNNLYCNPYNKIVVKRDSRLYEFSHWRNKFSNYDKNSSACKNSFKEHKVTQVGANLLKNSSFKQDVSDWEGSISYDAGRLKLVNERNASNILSHFFSLKQDQWYRVKFTGNGNGFGNTQLRLVEDLADEPWSIINESYLAYNTTKQQYEVFLQASKTTKFARLVLTIYDYDANTYWLDNISLEPVQIVKQNIVESAQLFTNSSNKTKTIDLKSEVYKTLAGDTLIGQLKLAPFSSQLLTLSTVYALDPKADTDGDGMLDRDEIKDGTTNPNKEDCPDWYCGSSKRNGWRVIFYDSAP